MTTKTMKDTTDKMFTTYLPDEATGLRFGGDEQNLATNLCCILILSLSRCESHRILQGDHFEG